MLITMDIESLSIYLIAFVLFFVIMKLYFMIAVKFSILDIPNERSSHKGHVVRGGGVIFVIGAIFGLFFRETVDYYFLTGLLLISSISFLDDVITLSPKIRMLIQLLSVTLLLYTLGYLELGALFYLPIVFILVIAMINAYNFMDGINGMNGLYSLVILLSVTLLESIKESKNESFILILCVSILVFGYFNFRKKAKCFSGDVGSISLAFVIIYLLLTNFNITNSLSLILFPLIYGLDTLWTVVERAINKEKLTEAHRKHLYQLLSNEMKVSHIKVSSIYAVIQLMINLSVIYFLHEHNYNEFIVVPSVILLSSIFYIIIKLQVYKKIGRSPFTKNV